MKEQNKRVIDIEFLRSVIDNDIEFEKELLAIFSENASRNLAKMEESAKNGDNNSWYMASHAFKGASASIGAFDLSKLLEHAQKHPEYSKREKEEIVEQVRKEVNLVFEFINRELLDK
jgi:HPt (histidine-containing phosphotransfer) domain-containing protein